MDREKEIQYENLARKLFDAMIECHRSGTMCGAEIVGVSEIVKLSFFEFIRNLEKARTEIDIIKIVDNWKKDQEV